MFLPRNLHVIALTTVALLASVVLPGCVTTHAPSATTATNVQPLIDKVKISKIEQGTVATAPTDLITCLPGGDEPLAVHASAAISDFTEYVVWTKDATPIIDFGGTATKLQANTHK